MVDRDGTPLSNSGLINKSCVNHLFEFYNSYKSRLKMAYLPVVCFINDFGHTLIVLLDYVLGRETLSRQPSDTCRLPVLPCSSPPVPSPCDPSPSSFTYHSFFSF